MLALYEFDADQLHQREVDRLIKKYGNSIQPEEIKRLYDCVLSEYHASSIKTYLPLIVGRKVKDILLHMIHI